MSLDVAAYLHDGFIGLPSVIDAGNDLKAKGGREMIYEVFGPLFTKHGVDERFGLGLLHRHFDMTPNERLVELNNIATPWDETDAESIGGGLLTQSWMFINNKIVPYEFLYLHGNDADAKRRLEGAGLVFLSGFLAEVYAKLVALGLDKTLGLRLHPGPEFNGLVEVTVGRANINFHPSQMSSKDSTETAWFFDPEYIKRGCSCRCNQVTPKHNHNGHYVTPGNALTE